jgi:hypothetical protein
MMKRLALAVLFGALTLVGASDASAAVNVNASVQVTAKVATPGAMFLTARPPRPILSPVRVTLGRWRGGHFHSRIVGMRTGGLVFAGVRARPIVLYAASPVVVIDRPSPVVVVDRPSPVVVVERPSPVIHVEVGGPRIHVRGKGRGHWRGRGRH